jgi:hypothetical protein
MSEVIDSSELTVFTAGDVLPSLTVSLSWEELPARTNKVLFHDTSSDGKPVIFSSSPRLSVGTDNNLVSFAEWRISVNLSTLSIHAHDVGGFHPSSSFLVEFGDVLSPVDLPLSVDSPHVTIATNIKRVHGSWWNFFPDWCSSAMRIADFWST